jgi:hypothetical protein
MNDEAGVPSDNTTLTAVLDDFASAGYVGQFEVLSESAIGCVACQEESAPADFAMAGLRRLEGASDPDDMMSVVALACPRCGVLGTLVLGYGPAASAEEAGVSKQLRDQHREGDVPPPTPGK